MPRTLFSASSNIAKNDKLCIHGARPAQLRLAVLNIWLALRALAIVSFLQKDATAWERWVYLFAQLRQLAVLAPVLPTADPQLRGSAYEMVLHAFLLSPTDHPHLLKLVQAWPHVLYSLPTLTQAVVQR